MAVTVGIKGRADDVVHEGNTAQAACSGALPVFGFFQNGYQCVRQGGKALKGLVNILRDGGLYYGGQGRQSDAGYEGGVSHVGFVLCTAQPGLVLPGWLVGGYVYFFSAGAGAVFFSTSSTELV